MSTQLSRTDLSYNKKFCFKLKKMADQGTKKVRSCMLESTLIGSHLTQGFLLISSFESFNGLAPSFNLLFDPLFSSAPLT